MCGFAGFVDWGLGAATVAHSSTDLSAIMEKADGLLRHRGPDARGQWQTVGAPRVCLVHRRLSIVDAAGGHQPMTAEDSHVRVVFNGEIYNHIALRDELTRLGHRFASHHSDTEVLVHGWEQWGARLPEKLRGMFAFAIWDQRQCELFLARDYFGQKPLFYALTDQQIAFGSTIPSVLCWPGVEPIASRKHLALYLNRGYVPVPHTIYRDIHSMEPGTSLHISAGGRQSRSNWNPCTPAAAWPVGQMPPRGQAALSQLRALIFSAVESQLHADVDMVCFLSGGIDSAITAGVAQHILGNARRLLAVTVGFSESDFDETALAVRTAKALGLAHYECRIDMQPSAVPTLEWLMDFALGQPFADSSILPTYWLANAARQLAPCALSGDGGDELFAGYDRYRAMRLLAAGVALPFIGSKSERWRRLRKASRQRQLRQKYCALTELFTFADLGEMAGEAMEFQSRSPDMAGHDTIRQCMLMDQYDYLPGDVLWKVDSASMACGLEVRSPLLDHHLANWANGMPGGDMMNWRQGKLLLRHAMRDFLPPAVQSGRKRGFAVPIGQWFKGSLRPALEDYLFAGDALTARMHLSSMARRLIDEHMAGMRDHTHRLFALLMMEVWHQRMKPTGWAD